MSESAVKISLAAESAFDFLILALGIFYFEIWNMKAEILKYQAEEAVFCVSDFAKYEADFFGNLIYKIRNFETPYLRIM